MDPKITLAMSLKLLKKGDTRYANSKMKDGIQKEILVLPEMGSQVADKVFDADSDVKLVHRIRRHLQKRSPVLHYPKLDSKKLHMRTFVDSGHATWIRMTCIRRWILLLVLTKI